MRTIRVLLVGGGSTGHLAPLVAVWREIERERPGARAFAIASTRGADREFLEREKMNYSLVPYPWRSLTLPLRLMQGFVKAWGVIGTFQPTVVFSKGGVISLPICLAARLRGVPVVVHESDAVMGIGTSLVRRLAARVCLGTDTGERGSGIVVTGNPVRPEILTGDSERGLAITGLSGAKPILFVTGGSQGAEALNRAVIDALPTLLPAVDIIHLTGKGKTAAAPVAGYWSAETSGGTMGDLYACASLALIRGGAGSIAETAAMGVPAIIVPLEGLAQDHQVHNAERAAASGGCKLLCQRDLSRLSSTITTLVRDPSRLHSMSVAVRTLQRPDAARLIAMTILEADSAQ